MNYQNRALIDELAAQYVIGTLRGAARRRFERICEHDTTTLHAVQRWEDRLIDLAAAVSPVRPPSTVWRAVQQRVLRSEAAARRERARRRYGG